MAEHKFERHNRDAQESFQDARSAATDAYKTSIDLFRRGMERNIEVQKQVLDAAAQQNAEIFDLWKSMYGSLPGAEPMLTLTEQTVETLIDLRRSFLDILEGESDEVAGSAGKQADRTERATQEMTEAARAHRERLKQTA
jgi:hypothetical protein